MPTLGFQVGDEVRLRLLKGQPVAVVTNNSFDNFCCIDKNGFTYNYPRDMVKPIKTGRRFDVKSFLQMIQ